MPSIVSLKYGSEISIKQSLKNINHLNFKNPILYNTKLLYCKSLYFLLNIHFIFFYPIFINPQKKEQGCK